MWETELEQRKNNRLLIKLGKSGNEIRETLVQVNGDKPPMNFFFLFPKITEILKERHFGDISSNTTAALKAIPQSRFQNCFEGWIRRWHRCRASKGEYFDGDHGGVQQMSTFTAMSSRTLLSDHVYHVSINKQLISYVYGTVHHLDS